MLAAGSLLAQLTPADALDQTLYLAGELHVEVTRIVVCNIDSTAGAYRLFHDVAGTTYGTGNALRYDKAIAANDHDDFVSESEGSGITLAPGDSLGCQSSVLNRYTFSVYGTTEHRGPRESEVR